MPKSRQELIPQARALYAQGLTLEQVAHSLLVSPPTVGRWKASDRRAGVDWDERAADQRRRDPLALLNILLDQRQKLVEAGPVDPAYADQLWKLNRVIESVRQEFKDPRRVMDVVDGIIEWAKKTMPDETYRPFCAALSAYLDSLKDSRA